MANIPSSESRRIRTKHHKTRTGCVTCRQRHLKCDEAKPVCHRCWKGGRECGGYNIPRPWLFEPDRPRDKPNQLPASLSIESDVLARSEILRRPSLSQQSKDDVEPVHQDVVIPIPTPVPTAIKETPHERRAFQLYVALCHPAAELAEESDLQLFCRVIPQVSHNVPAIRWGILCLSSFFASLADPSQGDKHIMFSEYQYMKIIKSMASSEAKNMSLVETLIICLLLVSIEAHRNEPERALIHMKAAVAVFLENQSSPPATCMDLSLRQVLERFCLQLMLAAKGRGEPVQSRLRTSLDSTYVHLDVNKVVHELCQELRGYNSLSITAKQSVQQTCLQILDRKMIQLEETFQTRLGRRDHLREAYLQIQYQISRLCLQTIHKPRLQMFEASDEAFQMIMDKCMHFANVNYRGDAVLTKSSTCPIRMGYCLEFILMVFFVACECHDLSIRRLAISFLRASCRRERLWDSFHAAKIADWLLHKEEKQRSIYASDKEGGKSYFILSSVQLYKDDDGVFSAFRRLSWALLDVDSQDGLTRHWVCLEEPQFGPVASSMPTQKPINIKLCYQLNGPVWPSTARMISQTCLPRKIQKRCPMNTDNGRKLEHTSSIDA